MNVERVVVLSWIQNFFQSNKNDDEDEFDDFELHYKTENLLASKMYENGKDLNVRVSYQYPKVGYRIPLTREASPKKEESLHKRRKERHIEEKKKEPTEDGTSTRVLPKVKNEQPPKLRRPFHPTEIPSPVFGFKRPNQRHPLIVHELCHFSNDVIEDQMETSVAMKESIIESKFPKLVENVPDVLLYTPPSVDVDKERELASNEETFSGEVDSEKELQQISPGDVARVEDTPETYLDLVQSEIAKVSNENSLLPLEEPDESTGSKESVVEALPDGQRSRRSHLPFNVMMLKQDKLKWEEKKKGRVEEQKPIPQREINQVITVRNHNMKREQPKEDTQLQMDSSLYEFPAFSLLKPPVFEVKDTEWLQQQEELLNQTLQNFNVGASVVNVTEGPAVTRFEVHPEPGVKVNKITNLSDDIKLSLAARDIRIEAPIPGKHTIGIEVPNQKSRPVFINEIIQSSVFKDAPSPLTAVLGLDIAGKPIVTDLRKMPHGLIAGATGSGKSVCINTIIVSLLYKARPEDLKLLLIDPKMVELAPYNHIPHLVCPVITDVKAATAALKWAVEEMERRYELFAHTGVRDINRFNELAMQHKRYSDKLPFIVIIIDELADLMMMSPGDVEEAICRIAQKARACGIHLIIATQRPSVDVITGLIKANIPTRIAFSVSSQIDSRTIIDMSGAEKLLGRGDMLFLENGSSKPVRLQGTYVSDEEIDLVVAHVREQREPDYLFEQEELLKKAEVTEEEDELFYEACEFIINQAGASTSSLQRRFKIGYNRAARLMDILEKQGYITGANGSKPRDVLITEADLETIQDVSANH